MDLSSPDDILKSDSLIYTIELREHCGTDFLDLNFFIPLLLVSRVRPPTLVELIPTLLKGLVVDAPISELPASSDVS